MDCLRLSGSRSSLSMNSLLSASEVSSVGSTDARRYFSGWTLGNGDDSWRHPGSGGSSRAKLGRKPSSNDRLSGNSDLRMSSKYPSFVKYPKCSARGCGFSLSCSASVSHTSRGMPMNLKPRCNFGLRATSSLSFRDSLSISKPSLVSASSSSFGTTAECSVPILDSVNPLPFVSLRCLAQLRQQSWVRVDALHSSQRQSADQPPTHRRHQRHGLIQLAVGFSEFTQKSSHLLSLWCSGAFEQHE